MLSRGLSRVNALRSVALKAAGRTSINAFPAVIARSKHWVPTEAKDVQKLTESALIHDISLHQMETVREVVPWFLNSMPVSPLVSNPGICLIVSVLLVTEFLLQPS
jgi:hypothetical protein